MTTPALAASSNASPVDRRTLLEAKTRAMLVAASKGDFDAATQDFDDTMKEGLPPSTFATTWAAIEKQVGKLQEIASIRVNVKATSGGPAHADATCTFEHANLVARVAYDGANRVAGLHFLPAASANAWTPPPYANPAAFEERAITVGTAPELPGTLTLPRGARPVPVVVLVHGSGPNDADESVGGVKVFKDLAWGLASRGVAVLRYVKRTRVDPAGVVTSKEEVLDDAHAAIELATRSPGVDPARVFLLGHSLGGYLAPRIARESPGLAGVIIMAGTTRPLEDVVIDQLVYLSSIDALGKAEDLSPMIEAARKTKALVESPALQAEDDVPFLSTTLKGAYFLDLRGYDPAAMAKTLACPILVLQGERDYQVTRKDLDGWRAALGKKANATIETYPSLNHLFVAGEGTPSPAEYEKPGHVDPAVVDDVAAWVTRAVGENGLTVGRVIADSNL